MSVVVMTEFKMSTSCAKPFRSLFCFCWLLTIAFAICLMSFVLANPSRPLPLSATVGEGRVYS